MALGLPLAHRALLEPAPQALSLMILSVLFLLVAQACCFTLVFVLAKPV